jgi:hypothetical protein
MRDHLPRMLEHGAGMKKGFEIEDVVVFAVVGRMAASTS